MTKVKRYSVHPVDPNKKYTPIIKSLAAAREYQRMYGGTIHEFTEEEEEGAK